MDRYKSSADSAALTFLSGHRQMGMRATGVPGLQGLSPHHSPVLACPRAAAEHSTRAPRLPEGGRKEVWSKVRAGPACPH